MALQWMDGFDHYGLDENNMLDGIYPEVDFTYFQLSTTNVRTGTHSIQVDFFGNFTSVRRIILGNPTVVGVGFAFYLSNLPSENNKFTLNSIRNASNEFMWAITVTTQGALEVRAGDEDGTILATSADGIVTANAFNHLEVKFDNSGPGQVSVRLNEVEVVIANGAPQFAGPIGNWALKGDSETFVTQWIDDIYCWDNTGSLNNDWLGDRRVLTVFPDSNDVAIADYTSIGGNGFDTIDEAAPDDDTSFIEFDTTVGNAGQFGLQDVPLDIANIAAVQTYTRMKKTDSGTANVQVALENQGSIANGTDRPITTAYTYWTDIYPLNPRLGIPWSAAEFNAAKVRFTRTA